MKLFCSQVGGLIAIAISGAILFIILLNPDSVGQLPDDWDSLLIALAVIGLLFLGGLSRLRPSLDTLREIWKDHGERIEKEVDLSDVEAPLGKGQRVSIYDLAQELGENPSTISNWCQNLNINSKYLNVEQVELIRNYRIMILEGLEVK